MKNIPVDSARLGSLALLSIAPFLDQTDVQKKNSDGLPLYKAECLLRPPADGSKYASKSEIILVAFPYLGAIPDFEPMSVVMFEDLTARAWEMNGRSGISLSAAGFLS